MPRQQRELLSFGMFVVIIAILLVAFGPSQDWGSMISLTLLLYGVWVIVLAGIRTKTPEKYGRSAFSTLVMGILLVALGGAWFIYIQTAYWLYSVVLLLLIVGLLAVASALLSVRKKP